jgi:hypothetical protein
VTSGSVHLSAYDVGNLCKKQHHDNRPGIGLKRKGNYQPERRCMGEKGSVTSRLLSSVACSLFSLHRFPKHKFMGNCIDPWTGALAGKAIYAGSYKPLGSPLWSSSQSSWLLTQRSRLRFPALPDFLSSSGSGTGFTQPL